MVSSREGIPLDAEGGKWDTSDLDRRSMKTPDTASSAYFTIPRFSKGDLEEVMSSFRPHEISEFSQELSGMDLPFFPFPCDSDHESR